jgi:3-methyladenine DNA glycosylase AlkD
LGYECHEFFDKVLTNKETVDYVIDHLAAANFDPEFFTSYEKEIRNNLLTIRWYKKIT